MLFRSPNMFRPNRLKGKLNSSHDCEEANVLADLGERWRKLSRPSSETYSSSTFPFEKRQIRTCSGKNSASPASENQFRELLPFSPRRLKRCSCTCRTACANMKQSTSSFSSQQRLSPLLPPAVYVLKCCFSAIVGQIEHAQGNHNNLENGYHFVLPQQLTD